MRGYIDRRVLRHLSGFYHNSKGNMAVLGAFTMIAMIVTAGAAYDYSNIVTARAKLQDSVDTAALAAASIARTDRKSIKPVGKKAVVDNADLIPGITLTGNPRVKIDNTAKEITVSAKAKYKTAFGSLLGLKKVKISASSTTGYAVEAMNPFTVFLVLDVSGSMSWVSTDGNIKVEALKTAVEDMFYTLYSTSENPSLLVSTIRTGYASYESVLGNTLPINTGYANTVSNVKTLTALGGTNSTPGMQYAYDQMTAEMAGKPNWQGYLVFMTDGNNNDPAYDTSTIALCDQAKADGMLIFTVAFDAPANGEALLETCATDKSKAYKSKNANKLNKAFRKIGKEISQSVVRIKR